MITVHPGPHTSLRSLHPVAGWPLASGQQKRATILVISHGLPVVPRLNPKFEKCTVCPLKTVAGSTATLPPKDVVQSGGTTWRSSATTARPPIVTRASIQRKALKLPTLTAMSLACRSRVLCLIRYASPLVLLPPSPTAVFYGSKPQDRAAPGRPAGTMAVAGLSASTYLVKPKLRERGGDCKRKRGRHLQAVASAPRLNKSPRSRLSVCFFDLSRYPELGG